MSMEIKRFNEIDLNDCFFDSLKEDYPGFDTWYNKKATAKETAFIQKDSSGNLQGFLYMKNEDEALLDITPNMPEAKRLKVGTFKIDALKSATKLFSVLLASKRPLITELADKLRLKYPLLPTISPCPTMRLEAIRSIIPISCRRYPKSV